MKFVVSFEISRTIHFATKKFLLIIKLKLHFRMRNSLIHRFFLLNRQSFVRSLLLSLLVFRLSMIFIQISWICSLQKKKILTQKKKNYRRNNELCLYCEEFDHFVKNHDNFQLLIFKKEIYNLRLIAMFLFFYYRDNECENSVKTTTKNEKSSN